MSAARNSADWFEHVGRYAAMEPEQFAYSLLSRSQRMSHEKLRRRDQVYVRGIESFIAAERACARAAAADVHAIQGARAYAEEPRRGVADGHVFVQRWHAR